MTSHLTNDQIAQWMLGERPAPVAAHVAGCAECRGEVLRFETTLVDFHDAAHDYAAMFPRQTPRRRRASVPVAARWALAAAAAIAAIVPMYVHHAREQAAIVAREDAALLRAVDTEISRAVPEPMEPLVSLVTWNTLVNQGADR